MKDRWAVLRDGLKHLGIGPEGKGLQPFYAACGLVELVLPQRPEMAARVCGRCKAAAIRGDGK